MKLIAIMVVFGLVSPALAALPTEERLEAALDGLRDSNTARVGWAEVPSIWESHFGSQQRRWHKSMRVEYSISKSGRITDCAVTETSGSSAFDSAACGALASVSDLPMARDASGKVVRANGTLDYKLFYGPGWICATGLDDE